jgi:hypothetical protein
MTTGTSRSHALEFAPTTWAAVTIRVAWTLMMDGIRVRPATLCDARDHVLASLPRAVGPDEAEQMADGLTGEFLSRMRGEAIRRVVRGTDGDLGVHLGWRKELHRLVDPVGDAILRLHYGDGLSIEQVERTAAIDLSALEASRAAIRDAVRSMANHEDSSAGGWSDSRIDAVIACIANLPEPGCPPPMAILSDIHRQHADVCPRCSRAVRLIRGGMIAPSDLVAPVEGVSFSPNLRVAAIVLHPDARKTRRKVERALGNGAVSVGADVWILSREELMTAGAALRALVTGGHLPRHHVRGALVSGVGRWSGSVLLGPVAVDAIESARSRPWAEVDTLGDLPPPRPAPPSAVRWWLSAAVLGLLSLGVGIRTFSAPEFLPDVPVEADFNSVEDGWEITFDADDLAVIDVIAVGENGPTVLHRDIRERRGEWATGEGEYRIYVPGSVVILLASESGIVNLEELVQRSRSKPAPMVSLEQWVRDEFPTVEWVGSPAVSTEQARAGTVPSDQL